MSTPTQEMLDLLESLQESLRPAELEMMGVFPDLLSYTLEKPTNSTTETHDLTAGQLVFPFDAENHPNGDSNAKDNAHSKATTADEDADYDCIDPLEAAQAIGNTLRESLFHKNALERLGTLLTEGADINTPDQYGTKLLAAAIMNKKSDVIRFILAFNSSAYELDGIDIAELSELCNEDMGDLRALSQEMLQEITGAISFKQLLAGKKILQTLQLDSDHNPSRYQKISVFFAQLTDQFLINAILKTDDSAALSELLEQGADINTIDQSGSTLLANAILNEKAPLVHFILNETSHAYTIQEVDLEEIFDLYDRRDSEEKTKTLQAFTDGVLASPTHTRACLALIQQLKPTPPHNNNNDSSKYDALEAHLLLPAAKRQLDKTQEELHQEEALIESIIAQNQAVQDVSPTHPSPDLTLQLQEAELHRQQLAQQLQMAQAQIATMKTVLDTEIERRRKAEGAMHAALNPAAVKARFSFR